MFTWGGGPAAGHGGETQNSGPQDGVGGGAASRLVASLGQRPPAQKVAVLGEVYASAQPSLSTYYGGYHRGHGEHLPKVGPKRASLIQHARRMPWRRKSRASLGVSNSSKVR